MLRVVGVNAHLVDAGCGRAVVLIHGAQSWGYTWRHQVQSLIEAGYRVIIPDLPGNGYSDSPDDFDYSINGLSDFLAYLLDALDLEHVVFAATAAGALPALDFTIRFPERVVGLGLVSACGVPHQEPFLWKYLHLPILSESADPQATYGQLSEMLRRGVFDGGLVSDEMVNAYHAPLRRSGSWKANLALEQNWHPEFVQESIDCIRCPVLILWGKQDPWHPLRMASEFKRRMVASQIELLEACGHFPQEEVPGRFNSKLASFLKDTVGY